MHSALRTIALFGMLMLLFTGIGYVVGWYFAGDWLLGSLFFLGIAAAMNLISYFFSGKIVLWSYRARISGIFMPSLRSSRSASQNPLGSPAPCL